ncbi:1046_t:CDS:2, partial [Racocetra fulgida]
MPSPNKGKSSGNPRCPECGNHYVDIHRHVRRIHRTDLSSLNQLVFQRKNKPPKNNPYQTTTRKERRNEILYNKSQLLKLIDGYVRVLRNQKRNGLENSSLINEEIKWFNNLRVHTKDLDKNDLSLFKSKYSDFNKEKYEITIIELDQKNEEINKLTKSGSDLNLANETKDTMIISLEAQIKALKSEAEVLRINFDLADSERSRNATNMYDLELKLNDVNNKHSNLVEDHKLETQWSDQKETDLHKQIDLLKHRIEELESSLDKLSILIDISKDLAKIHKAI